MLSGCFVRMRTAHLNSAQHVLRLHAGPDADRAPCLCSLSSLPRGFCFIAFAMAPRRLHSLPWAGIIAKQTKNARSHTRRHETVFTYTNKCAGGDSDFVVAEAHAVCTRLIFSPYLVC
jgi:hypothetical protein